VSQHLPDVARALGQLPLPHPSTLGPTSPWWLLIEVTSPRADTDAQDQLASLFDTDATGETVHLAQSPTQRAAMWRLREAIPMAEKIAGRMVKHDIGLPTSRIPHFIDQVESTLRQRWADARVVCFGHLGDGNLHFNVQPPPALAHGADFDAFEHEANQLVFDTVQALGGTLSAEHGIGELRKHELARRHPAAALAAMHAIKQALDPHGLFNPGRVLAQAQDAGARR
jgi:FAD/FMN-containing dehydrogenase